MPPLPETLLPWTQQYWPQYEVGVETELPKSDDITFVTAFFDIGRSDWRTKRTGEQSIFVRNTDTYFNCFHRLAKIKNELIVFVAEEHAPRVLAARHALGLEGKTVIYVIENLFSHPSIVDIEQSPQRLMTAEFREFVTLPESPEYLYPRYNILNALKATFVATALDFGIVKTQQVAWIDFGYCRDED
jgi:protein YibB